MSVVKHGRYIWDNIARKQATKVYDYAIHSEDRDTEAEDIKETHVLAEAMH